MFLCGIFGTSSKGCRHPVSKNISKDSYLFGKLFITFYLQKDSIVNCVYVHSMLTVERIIYDWACLQRGKSMTTNGRIMPGTHYSRFAHYTLQSFDRLYM